MPQRARRGGDGQVRRRLQEGGLDARGEHGLGQSEMGRSGQGRGCPAAGAQGGDLNISTAAVAATPLRIPVPTLLPCRPHCPLYRRMTCSATSSASTAPRTGPSSPTASRGAPARAAASGAGAAVDVLLRPLRQRRHQRQPPCRGCGSCIALCQLPGAPDTAPPSHIVYCLRRSLAAPLPRPPQVVQPAQPRGEEGALQPVGGCSDHQGAPRARQQVGK